MSTSSSFTASLRASHEDLWSRAVDHPMTHAFATHSISFRSAQIYFKEDYKFLHAFTELLRATIHSKEGLSEPEAIPLRGFLSSVVSSGAEEDNFFHRALQFLEVEVESAKTGPPEPATSGFISLMQEVTSEETGSLVLRLVVLVVAEWSYCEWCTRAKGQVRHTTEKGAEIETANRREGEDHVKMTIHDVCEEWIDLHASPSFQSFVQHLRAILDVRADSMSAKEKADVEKVFVRAIRLEGDFFEMAFDGRQ